MHTEKFIQSQKLPDLSEPKHLLPSSIKSHHFILSVDKSHVYLHTLFFKIYFYITLLFTIIWAESKHLIASLEDLNLNICIYLYLSFSPRM
jgi:hypothetical protein